tara:strand:- start:966 stop:1406 length:441 start_codon:yes stop_codon:yes gene_type:complete
MPKYTFHGRFMQLITMDNIRKYKIIEMIQYTFFFFVLSLVVATILNKTYYERVRRLDEKMEKRKTTIWEIGKLTLLVFFETMFLTILVFYMRKLVLLVPSYGAMKSNKFIPFTTISYVCDFTLLFAFIEMLPEYRKQFDRLGDLLQ